LTVRKNRSNHNKATGEVDVDRAASEVFEEVARGHLRKVGRRKFAIEMACMCPDEMTPAGRVQLARAIDRYVYGDE
jgi:hypothetical protein